jgi:acylphosphatase
MTDVVRRYRVQGRVQGVGFRWFVREEARALGLRGWVQNELSGEVLLEAGGESTRLDRLADRLAVGPAASYVTAISIEPAAALGVWDLPAPFAVRR